MSAAPTVEASRIVALDVLRGFALYGVFLVNAYVSAVPMRVAMTPPPQGSSISEVLAWMVFDSLLVTKFVAIFSFLFGMGLMLQYQRAEQLGLPFTWLYLRRLAILAVMGLIHGLLLFEGDILFVYACFGFLLFLCRGASAGTLVKIALLPLTIGLALTLTWIVLGYDGWPSSLDEFEVKAEQARRSGSLFDVLPIRRWEYVGWLILSCFSSFNWRVVGLFFLGAAFSKQGLVNPSYSQLHRQMALIGLVIGGLLESGGSVVTLMLDQPPVAVRAVLGVMDEVGSLVLSAGYVGAVLWLVHLLPLGWIQLGFAAVGRTALSNYILQSVLMNLIFMAFGLGLYQQLSRAEVLVWMSAIFAIQMGVSALWLKRFQQGPLEWVWRKLTYLT